MWFAGSVVIPVVPTRPGLTPVESGGGLCPVLPWF